MQQVRLLPERHRRWWLHLWLLGLLSALGPIVGPSQVSGAEPRWLDRALHHLRIDGPREWSRFAAKPEGERLQLKFTAAADQREQTLRLRQQDVKQNWTVWLNARQLGSLVRDENDMVIYLPVPPGALATGENTLRIQQSGGRAVPDDIRVGQIMLDPRPMSDVLSEASVEIDVIQQDAQAKNIPARLTILDEAGALQTTGADSNDHLAVRPGTIYTSTGHATFGLPAGRYTIYAGRGFEYSLAAVTLVVEPGSRVRRTLGIRREVPTEGYVACDTHIHSLTHSGHGDASVQERMITIAAEGVELAIATDHNVHVDHEPFARQMKVRNYFTPVIGNEVTTKLGHFNVFPVAADAPVPDYRHSDWPSIFKEIYQTPNVKVVILNHARDLHGGTRPFGPAWHNWVVGQNLQGWQLQANAMEVINSGATQSDPMRLFHDWMGMLNGGNLLTPVGSSDSHDVARHFVGQGRTYIRCNDRQPGNIDVDAAVISFTQGQVMVSYGLLAQLTVEGRHGSGELVPLAGEHVALEVRVLGPHWVKATQLQLFANGQKVREVAIDAAQQVASGVKWVGQWQMPRPKHDVHLVAVALGPGIDEPYWKTAKPYQPTSPVWQARVIGCSGAVWLDADGDGRKTSARDYARRLLREADGDLDRLIERLDGYDAAVAAQAGHLYQTAGHSLLDPAAQSVLQRAAPASRAGFQAYLNAWRENQLATSP